MSSDWVVDTRPIPRKPLTKIAKRRILLGTTLVVGSLTSLHMRNTAFIDEALYINAGHAYIDHWTTGSSIGDAGAFFSGSPLLYPVAAAAIDIAGGLLLVRFFSLICILLATLLLHNTARYLWGPRAGLTVAAVFLFSGPILFMGSLATFDAPVVMMLCLSLWLGITKRNMAWGLLVGAILALMTATKYTGGIFVPVVIAAIIVVGNQGVIKWYNSRIARGIVTALTFAAILSAVWYRWGDSVREALEFTTTNRKALSPAPAGTLFGYVWSYLGLVIVFALIGIFILFKREGIRHGIFGIGMLGAAALLPVAQMRLGEAVSFEKHLGYSAIFLALLAGFMLTRVSQFPLMVTPIVLMIIIVLMIGWARSDNMYQWVNVSSVVNAIEVDPKPGIYISSATDSLKYHTKQHTDIRWETTFNLYAEGEQEIRRAIISERYQTVILRTASTGSPEQDAGQAVMLDALRNSPSYDLAFEPFPVTRVGNDHWLYYTLIPKTTS